MWLDRLAAQATGSGSSTPQQPGSRPYSPLPRRTSSNLSPYVTSQRAGHSPRSSSLSLVSNDSSTSLLASSKRPNGSSLRQTSTIPSVSDSLETLEKLLKPQDETESDLAKYNARTTSIVEADLTLDVDFRGLSLKELAASQPPDAAVSVRRQPQAVEECTLDLPWRERLNCRSTDFDN